MHAALDQHGRNYKEALKRLVLLLVLIGTTAGAAHAAGPVAVVVVPPGDPFPNDGAVGLFVPGAGDSVSGESARAALVRGKTRKSVLGGKPSGKPMISVSTRPARTTIYVSLPPSGKHANTRRYPIAIVGPGYRGILTSHSTRIRGLISIADIAPTARALARGDRPVIRSRPDDRAAPHVAELDRRLTRSHDVRLWETLILVLAVLGGAVLAVSFRSEYLGRAGLLAAPSVLTAALILSAANVARPHLVVTLLPLIALGLAALLAIPRGLLPWALVGFIVFYLVVFVGWSEIASFSAIGASPDGGGRFYGAGNLVETVLLTVSVEAAALLGRRAILPVLVLTLVTVGWSRAGADGGGIVVLLAAFAVLSSRMYDVRWTWRRAVAAIVVGVLIVGALVGLDAASGGSSHVTHAFRQGPVSLAEDLGSRLHISVASLGASTTQAIVFGVSIAALVVLAIGWPRFPAGDALLTGIAVSLFVNDSPGAVASAGALSYAVLFAYERVSRPARDQRRVGNVGSRVPGFASRA
jgi:hypothetical protein